MAKTEALELSVWDFAPDAADHLPVTRFQLGTTAHAALAQWCRERTGRTGEEPITVVLRGLAEVLAWFAPDVGFVRHERDAAGGPGQRLSLYFVGDRRDEPLLRRGVQAGLQAWVNLLYPEKPPEVRQQIAASAQADAAWTLVEVGCALDTRRGACPRAAHPLFWDALAAYAAQRLKGQFLQFESAERRMLVARTAQASAFDGLELVAYPPKQGDGGGLWSEVVTLHTPTYPERGGVHLLARPSIRNWGPVTRWAGYGDPDRSLDVFFPGQDAEGASTLRHTSFTFSAREGDKPQDGGRAPVKAVWPHKQDQRVLDLLRRFTGRSALAPDEVAEPVVDENGLWVLPRLGTVHGDDRLPGGSGVSWPDRRDIARSLDAPLAEAGFRRVEPMRRAKRSMKLDTPFAAGGEAQVEAWPAKRAAIRAALAANDVGPELSLFVLHRLEDTPARIERLVGELLGPADQVEAGVLAWEDGLVVRVIAAPSGPLAEQLERPAVTPEEEAGKTPKQIEALRELKRKSAADVAEARMAAHLGALRQGQSGIACALLEMPEGHRAKPRTDPFQLARRELARHGMLPQVVLVEGAAAKPTKTPDATDGDHRYLSAVSDLLRMLGVLPTEALPRAFAPAALTIVQRNADWIGGGYRAGQALALAARVKDGRLEAAVPNEAGAPVWAPYARTALRILCGEYERFGRSRQAENVARFETFFARAVTDIDRGGRALVLAEGETLRHKLKTFLNSELTFDRLAFGVEAMTTTDLPNTRLVRLSPDRDRQPPYYQDTTKWPSGLFAWGGARRTFFALKAKPVTVSAKQSFASLASRHGPVGDNRFPPQPGVPRVASQLDELCVQFMQADDDPLELVHLTHRLRGAHAQTRAQTVQPFPLHELRLLGGGITL